MMRPGAGVEVVYLCREWVDFRKSIAGLSVLVEQQFQLNPFAPALFVFCNRKRDKLKVLYWEKNGFCLWYKRLEQEKFKWPSHLTGTTVTLTAQELNWLLDGFDLWRNSPHKALHFTAVS